MTYDSNGKIISQDSISDSEMHAAYLRKEPYYGIVLPMIAQSTFRENENVYQLETDIWSTKVTWLVNKQKIVMLATPVAITIWNVTKEALIVAFIFIAVVVSLFIKKQHMRSK